MQINARNEFAASPDKVVAMMLDKSFNEQVCAASPADTYEVSVEGDRVVRTMHMEAPAVAQKFVKGTVKGVQETEWGPVQADGSRVGTVRIYSPGHSQGALDGTVTIRPEGDRTVLAYDGELKVNIPFIGKKLEKSAEPYITDALSIEQKVGEKWLAEH